MTEAELIRIYRSNTRRLYEYVSRRVGGDRGLAEDIVQETWLRAVNAWRRRGAPDTPLAWLIRVARNLLVSHFRRRLPQSVDAVGLELADDTVDLDTPWTAALLNWGLARIKRSHAELLEAFYFDGRSVREIATRAGLSERAVEGRLRRARQSLKKRLKPLVKVDARTAGPVDPTEANAVLELSRGGKKHA